KRIAMASAPFGLVQGQRGEAVRPVLGAGVGADVAAGEAQRVAPGGVLRIEYPARGAREARFDIEPVGQGVEIEQQLAGFTAFELLDQQFGAVAARDGLPGDPPWRVAWRPGAQARKIVLVAT